ncbi:hypothetical protein ACFLTR_02955 [Chloroflexota bacterium]
MLGELPKKVQENLEQGAGCIAGALNEKTYLDKIRVAGFVEVTVERNKLPFYVESEASQPKNPGGRQAYLDLRDKVASVRVKAFKPDKT